jgi:hypothetical protein
VQVCAWLILDRYRTTEKDTMTAPTNTTREGYDWLGYPLPTETGPRCGMCRRGIRHIDLAAIRACCDITREQEEQAEADSRLEDAQLRYLENRGYDEARAQDDYEARNGVIGFREAWHNESPDTCPCCN